MELIEGKAVQHDDLDDSRAGNAQYENMISDDIHRSTSQRESTNDGAMQFISYFQPLPFYFILFPD